MEKQNSKIFSVFDFLYPWLLFCAEWLCPDYPSFLLFDANSEGVCPVSDLKTLQK